MGFDVIFAYAKEDEEKLLAEGFRKEEVLIRTPLESKEKAESNLFSMIRRTGTRVYQFVHTSYWGAGND